MPSANAQRNNKLEMTAVSVFYDVGVNPLRKEATRKAVQHWMLQSHLPKEFLFIELGFDGQFTFSSQDFPEQIHYIRIDGTERNKYLFQKEHLWNIAAKMATYEKLMFIDSDVAPIDDQDWFRKVYGTLDKCLFTQGFSIIHYLDEIDKPTWLNKVSYTLSFIQKNEINPAYGVPCGVFCIDKNTLQAIGWFNGSPIGIGDVLLWYEMTGKTTPGSEFICSLFSRQNVKTMFYAIQMAEGKKLMCEVNVDISHFYHGPFENRSYDQRNYMWMSQYLWFERILHIDEQGLMAWTSTKHYFYKVMSKFNTVNNDKQVAARLFDGRFDYLGFVKDFKYEEFMKMDTSQKIKMNLTRLILKHTIK